METNGDGPLGQKLLRRRIDPPDRRCYAFFHPALVDEPLIFVEVALTREIPAAIAPILAVERDVIEPDKAATAVFYSISNCQRGLTGVSFGHFLIKQVAEEIARENARLSRFVTLSPVPGFAAWLKRERAAEGSKAFTPEDRAALAHLDTPGWWQTPKIARRGRGAVAARGGVVFPARARTQPARRSIRSPASISATARGSSGSNWLADISDKAHRAVATA